MGTTKRTTKPKQKRTAGFADALFSKTQQRVLGLLFGQPGRSFYGNEIVRAADAGTGAVQRELARLAAAGLVRVREVGHQKHYQVNEASPVYAELRGLVLKTSGLVDVLRTALVPLSSRIRCAFVYGSVAKQSDTAHSDVDLLLVGDGLTTSEVLEALQSAEAMLKRKVEPVVYSSEELQQKRRAGNAFIERLLDGPKLFVIGSDDGFR